MQPNRFMVLTGHLNDYPLSDLVGILRHQEKTGRLLIEYAKGPAMFFFREGELVDVQLDKLSGLQAICVALAQPPASFNFNPLIQPTRRTIDRSFQKVVCELFGCWDESALDVQGVSRNVNEPEPQLNSGQQAALRDQSQPALLNGSSDQSAFTSTSPLLLSSGQPPSRLSAPVVVMGAAGLLMLGLSTVIGVTGVLGSRTPTAAVPSAAPTVSDEKSQPVNTDAATKTERKSESTQREFLRPKERWATSSSHSEARGSEVADNTKSESSKPSSPHSDMTKVANDQSSSTTRSVKVILQVENGRVSQASIGNHKPGMDAYEALALRIARQRRYPSKTGQETVMINVSQPD